MAAKLSFQSEIQYGFSEKSPGIFDYGIKQGQKTVVGKQR